MICEHVLISYLVYSDKHIKTKLHCDVLSAVSFFAYVMSSLATKLSSYISLFASIRSTYMAYCSIKRV